MGTIIIFLLCAVCAYGQQSTTDGLPEGAGVGAATQAEIDSNTSANAGTVTVHSDISNAGSGSIITGPERGAITTNSAKVGYTESAVSNNNAVAANSLKVSYTDASKVAGIADGSTSNNSANITGLVTVHSDVSSAGSGAIITAGERGEIVTNSAKVGYTASAATSDGFVQNPRQYPVTDSNKVAVLDVYSGSNNTYHGTAYYAGFIGTTNAQRKSASDVYTLWVNAPTNDATLDPHAIGLWLGDDTMTNQSIHGLHAYCTKAGTNLHVFKLDRNTSGGGEFQLYDGEEQLVVDINATDNPELLVVGRFTAREGTGSGVSPNAAADSFIVDSSSLNSGITLTSANGGNANILFGTANKGNNAASFQYISSIDRLRFKVANVTKAEILTGSVDISTNLNVAADLDVNGAADFAQRPTVGTQEVAYVSQLGSGGGGATTNDVAAQWPLLDYQVDTNANFQTQLDNKLEQLGTGEQSTNSALLTCTTSPSLSEGVFLRVPLNTNFVTQIGGWDFGGFLDAADNRVLFSSSGPGKYTGFLMASFGGANDIEDVSLQAYKTDGTTTNSFWLTSYAHSGAATYSPTIQYPFSLDITSAVQSIWFDIRVTGTSGDETINGPRTGIYIEKVSTPPEERFERVILEGQNGTNMILSHVWLNSSSNQLAITMDGSGVTNYISAE